MSWLQPLKEVHPKMRDFNWPSPGTSMVPATKRLWMLSLSKWRIICMPPRLDGIRLWSLPNPTWKATPLHGGGHWDKKRGKTIVYTWEFFKECVESKFVPRNFDYISRCKFRDLVNATNDNLRQYVRAYSELMFEIWHMHELDRVCQFVMGLPTWAKHKLEEN